MLRDHGILVRAFDHVPAADVEGSGKPRTTLANRDKT
jgi:hypothetical protein